MNITQSIALKSNMADDAEKTEDRNFENESKNNRKETNLKGNEAAETKSEKAKSLDCAKEPNEQKPDDFKPENDTSFKVPSSIQKDAKSGEPVCVEKKEKAPELKYKEPWWSIKPPTENNFSLEVLKNGCIISTLNLNDKPYYVFGRLPSCDVVLEHPSISRYHALVQYRGETDGDRTLCGFYLYDLGSTHGTVVNKSKIRAKTYYKLKVGYVIKFGGSSRLFILEGPQEDEEEQLQARPSEATTTENETKAKVGQIFTDEEYESLKKVETKSEESEGIDWGFGEDAEEEQIDSEKFQELYSGVEFKDPKKTLRGYYEREGLELEYQVDETGPGHARVYHCRVRLPVDGPNGSAVYAEASVTGRKKDAVQECANEACKMLDAYGLLRQSSHESRKKRERNLEEYDFYESDEDNFLDRTGTIEKKRIKRMRKAGKEKSEVETYDSLLNKLQKVQEEIQVLVKRIQDAEAVEDTDNGDSLDNYMNTMSQKMDKQTKIKLKRKIVELRKEEERTKKLVDLTKPTDLSSLQSSATKTVLPDVTHDNRDEKSPSSEVKDSPMTEIDKSKETRIESNVASGQDEAPTDKQISTTNISLVEEKTNPKTKSETFSGFAVPTSTVKPVKPANISKPTHSRDTARTQAKDRKDVRQPLKPTTEELGSEETLKHAGNVMAEKKNTFEDESKTVKKAKRYTVPTQWEDANNPDFASWIPPEDQSGDGKTKLNEKYGY